MSFPNKKILVFSLAYHPVESGAEVAIKEITDRIGTIEWDLVTLRFSKSDSKQEKIGNVNVYRIGGGWGYFSKVIYLFQAALFTRGGKYDIYWCMMTYMLFPVVIMRIFGNRTPYVLTLQDGDPFKHVFARARIFPFLPLLFYGFRYASKVQTISTYLAGWAKQMGYRGEVDVIPNGVNIHKFVNNESRITNKDEVVLVHTGRLVKKNGVGDVIEALKLLPENVKFKIIGSGILEAELKQQVSILHLENRVEFIDHVENNDIPKYLYESDIFIRPSLSEGQGISFIEAMAAGLPVIATRVGGIPDFLKDGETGLFCEVNNPESIAKQVRRLMEDSVLRRDLVKNAQEMVREKYDWNPIALDMKKRIFDISIIV